MYLQGNTTIMQYFNYPYILFFGILFISLKSSAQNISIDSLVKLNYNELKNAITENRDDSLTAEIYTEAYLKKAFIEKDTVKIAYGYFNKILLDNKTNNHLLDSIIALTQNLKNENFPSIAYFDKGSYYTQKRNFKKATDYFLKAIEYNKGSNKDNLTFLLNNAMAYLKNRMGEPKEALSLYENSWEYAIQIKLKELSPEHYLSLVFDMAHTYRKNNMLEKAHEYNNLGVKDAKLFGDKRMIYMFTLNDGLINFHKKNYRTALDTIEAILPDVIRMEDKPNTAVGYHYLGKLQYIFDMKTEAAISFKEVDTVFQQTRDLLPELRESYEYLIDYHKNEGDLSAQLNYVEQLMKLDSILTENYKYVTKNIHQKYDTQKLVSEKQQIITQLESEKTRNQLITTGIAIGFLLAVFFGVYQFRKKKTYKKRFKDLLENNPSNNTFSVKEHLTQSVPELGVPENIVITILEALESFEEKNGYLDSSMTLNKLATKFKTNSNYLSKVINAYKKENFSTYVKKLRVTYAMQRIKTDATFRKYTIKAIAEESGFKSAEAFSKSFHNTYGIYPSYFIKELDKLK